MNSKFWEEQFEGKARSPATWVLQARRLKRAADLLFSEYVSDVHELVGGRSPLDLKNLEIVGPATLLYGLAFENVIKSILIQENGAVIEQGKLKRWSGSGHQLVDLANLAKIRLTASHRDFLRRLTAFVEWGGRYPIPMDQRKMPLRQKAVSPEWAPLPIQPGELAAIGDFYQTLDALVVDA